MMHVYSLRREHRVARSLERLFPFFAQPENLALITPSATEENIS